MTAAIMDDHNSLQQRLELVLQKVCELDDDGLDVDGDEEAVDLSHETFGGLSAEVQELVAGKGGVASDSSLKMVDTCFNSCDMKFKKLDEREEFEIIQDFILTEQNSGRKRRSTARILEAKEEKRLAADIAQLKGFRLSLKNKNSQEDLQRKISDAERKYVSRKMVFAKAAQTAGAECRLQFMRVRDFFEKLHEIRQRQLRQQYRRSLKLQAIKHRLQRADARVVALDRQISNRLYEKKKADLNELHAVQNMEEALYLETMMALLDRVQVGKEDAARALFELQVGNLKARQEADNRRSQEMELFVAAATIELANVVAGYAEEAQESDEAALLVEEGAGSMDRRRDFDSSSIAVTSVSELYDTVLWSVASDELGLGSSSDASSTIFSVNFDDDENGEGQTQDENEEAEQSSSMSWSRIPRGKQLDDGSTARDGSTVGDNSTGRSGDISPPGRMHLKQLKRDISAKQKALTEKHDAEMKQEHHEHRKEVRALKSKHQALIRRQIEDSLTERMKLREGIDDRMAALVKRHEASTTQLRKTIEMDVQVMQEALLAEDKRLAEAEMKSFTKAQTLISAQVFHEVRNALSSVVAMSEMTSALKEDHNASPSDLIHSVDEMLDQSQEVVGYSLQMLNNILDTSKISSGSFDVKYAPVDLNDLMTRTTKMQLPKATHVNMSFVPHFPKCIAVSDVDLLVRIITNLTSNALKFTSSGAIQPFVWPAEDLYPMQVENAGSCSTGASSESGTGSGSETEWADGVMKAVISRSKKRIGGGNTVVDFKNCDANMKLRRVAIGVADSGPGLRKELLDMSQTGILNSETGEVTHGAQNSGFGLHLIQMLAGALGTKLRMSSLECCSSYLNEDMKNAVQRRRDQVEGKHGETQTDEGGKIAGPGTVLYITVPMFEDGDSAMMAFQDKSKKTEVATETLGSKLVFRPRPSSTSADGSFRILVADDVLMLRKGLMHMLCKVFMDCPVSITTACTAEDVLRALKVQPFDLVICDNQFNHDPTKLKKIEGDETERPSFFFDGHSESKKTLHELFSRYFENERFTLEEGDGNLTGRGALVQIAKSKEYRSFPKPMLILLSGHKIKVPDDLGIIVAQKPMKQSEFASVLEAHASKLVETGQFVQQKDDTTERETSSDSTVETRSSCATTLVNGHGSQIFICTQSLESGI